MNSAEYLTIMADLVQKINAVAADAAVEAIMAAMKTNHTIFVAGNGGSAATANHFAADFGKNVVKGDENRPRIMSLCSNMGILSAYANDVDPALVYAQLVYGYGKKGDLEIYVINIQDIQYERSAG